MTRVFSLVSWFGFKGTTRLAWLDAESIWIAHTELTFVAASDRAVQAKKEGRGSIGAQAASDIINLKSELMGWGDSKDLNLNGLNSEWLTWTNPVPKNVANLRINERIKRTCSVSQISCSYQFLLLIIDWVLSFLKDHSQRNQQKHALGAIPPGPTHHWKNANFKCCLIICLLIKRSFKFLLS